MEPYNHSQFIQTPLFKDLQTKIASFATLGDTIEVFAIQDSFMNSLFLSLTGAQEQKSKCICWMLAQYDLEYRRTRFFADWKLSECSTLIDKNAVYNDLVQQTQKISAGYRVFMDDADKLNFISHVRTSMYSLFDGTNLIKQREKEYVTYKEIFDNLSINNIDGEKQLFKSSGNKNPQKMKDNTDVLLSVVYSLLYRHRNRLAHNTLSYQENLPDISILHNEKIQRYSNIFLYITILVIIDELYRRVYGEFLNKISLL